MRVIVTGAASFIGSAVVRRLLDRGDDVCAVVRPASASTADFKKMLKHGYPEASSRIKVVELDLQNITELPGIISPAVTGNGGVSGSLCDRPVYEDPCGKWDIFLHAAWEGAGSDNRAREDVQSSNVAHTLEALRAAAALGCGRFIFTGSQAEYGMHKGVTDEDTPCSPISPYGKAKVAVSNEALPLSKELGIDYVHARLYSVYGPGDHSWSLINSCLEHWREKKPIELGPCTQLWNFLYIDDAAAALTDLFSQGKAGFYNIAGEDTRPLSEYIGEMARICGADGLYTFGEREPNVEGPADLNPDISKIEEDTSWRPKTSFNDGISRMWRMETEK